MKLKQTAGVANVIRPCYCILSWRWRFRSPCVVGRRTQLVLQRRRWPIGSGAANRIEIAEARPVAPLCITDRGEIKLYGPLEYSARLETDLRNFSPHDCPACRNCEFIVTSMRTVNSFPLTSPLIKLYNLFIKVNQGHSLLCMTLRRL